jgi:protein SCO1
MRRLLAAALGILVTASLVAPALAQPNVQAPAAMYSYDQKLTEQVPLDLTFADESGQDVTLESFFGKRPVVLALVQYRCPQLCNEVLNGLTSCLAEIPGKPGEDYEVVVVSFDYREKGMPQLASAKKASYIDEYLRVYEQNQKKIPGGRALTEAGEKALRERLNASWHFLAGDIPQIERLTVTVGFRFDYNRQGDRFAHPSGVLVLTPRGVISRYFYGIQYDPNEMREALAKASHNEIGRKLRTFEQVLLLCYDFDAESGAMKANIMKIVRTAGVVTVLALLAFLFFGSWLRPRTVPPPATPAQPVADHSTSGGISL